MITATKENREIETDKRVQVYFNLHRKVWSVRQNGLVVAHVDSIVLRDPKYVVSAAGNKRVRSEKRKNVHAYISGYVHEPRSLSIFPEDIKLVTYNPYKHDSFVVEGSEEPIYNSEFVQMDVFKQKTHVEALWYSVP
jgi:hypothetical protein